MEHYLDNSATTKTLKESAERALYVMTQEYGNPSSLHSMGFRAKLVLDEAREAAAEKLLCKSAEVYFTSGGTEANNLAIFGAAEAKKRQGNKIVTTAIEHPSVLEAMKELEKAGFDVVYVKPDRDGNIPAESFEESIDESTVLVSAMLMNNEAGAVLPVKEIAAIIRRKQSPAILHTDAVQAFCKTDFTPRKLGADLLTVSGHKVHAPKGVGALYVNEKARIRPMLYGGGQERGYRPGTEALPLIAAFSEAVKRAGSVKESTAHAESLNLYLREKLREIPGVEINSPQDASPYILNFSVDRIKAETMLHFLSQREVYVSSGSACGRAKPSHVLKAMGLPKERVESAIRASFSRFNNVEDIDALVDGVKAGIETLARF